MFAPRRKKILIASIIFIIGFFFFLISSSKIGQSQIPPPAPPIIEQISGWLWSAHGTTGNTPAGVGWISLNSKNCDDSELCDKSSDCNPQVSWCAPTVRYGVQATIAPESGAGVLIGYGWSPSLGWICFGSTCSGMPPAGVAPPVLRAAIMPVSDEDWRVEGWAKIINLGDDGWIHLGSSTSSYGLRIDRQTKEWSGYAWHGWSGGDPPAGIGWLVPRAQGGIIIQPWVETKGGDVHSSRQIRGLEPQTPPGLFNSAYLIQASGDESGSTTIDWISQGGSSAPFIGTSAPRKSLPAQTSGYATALGRIDFSSLYAGQYGEVVLNPGAPPASLGGKVYVVENDLTLASQAVEITSGAGTIIVEGNLTISGNITYVDAQSARRQDLPSLAWIVLGDIRIEPAVTEIDGTMIALGNGSSCAGDNPVIGCGQIFTGASQSPLTIRGALFAKRFALQRTGRFIDRGAEQIIFDGRLLANTPPGLGDLVKGLPTVKGE